MEEIPAALPVPQPPAGCGNKRSGLGAEGSLRQQEHTRNTSSELLWEFKTSCSASLSDLGLLGPQCTAKLPLQPPRLPSMPALMDGTKVTADTASMLSPKSSINTQACGANCSLFLSPYAIDLTITQQCSTWVVAHFQWVSGFYFLGIASHTCIHYTL